MNNTKQHWLVYYATHPTNIQILKSNRTIFHPKKTITVASGTLLNIKNNPTKIPWEMLYFDKHKTLLLELYDMALTNNTEEEQEQKYIGRIFR